MPILEANCVKCHGEEKQKSKLRLDSYAAVMEGTPDDKIVVAGDLIGSSLFQLITLPADDDDLMPPKNGPLSENEIAQIRNWIVKGAKAEAEVVVDGNSTDGSIVPATEGPKIDGDSLRLDLPLLRERCDRSNGAASIYNVGSGSSFGFVLGSSAYLRVLSSPLVRSNRDPAVSPSGSGFV